MVIPVYVTLVRLLVPIFILKWPLFGILTASLADVYDWQFINAENEDDYSLYQNWDKLMDLYYWIFALFVIFKWRDVLAKKIAVGLFVYRILGMIIFWINGQRIFLFLFPNFFENFFIFYLIFNLIFKKEVLLTSSKILFIVLSVIVIPKLVHEYFMHFLEKQPWEFYSVGGFLGLSGIVEEYANYLSFGTIFYLVPFTIGLFLVNKHKQRVN